MLSAFATVYRINHVNWFSKNGKFSFYVKVTCLLMRCTVMTHLPH